MAVDSFAAFAFNLPGGPHGYINERWPSSSLSARCMSAVRVVQECLDNDRGNHLETFPLLSIIHDLPY